ncbi:SWIM zinc finger family protein [Salinigranum halophilum]|uniref:SWIM zinc finger family protein n=1 Tax=Salinigranum halophilum TaxID=2565931 RepID=UPI0010A7D29B|nr:SWIM zinc finger family protein [Salinigranum halophilum]
MTHPAHTPASQHTRLPSAGTTGRALRARTEPMTVRPLRDRRYVVETDGGTYVVDIERRTCTCPDHVIRGARCKHLRRVAIEVTERRVPAPDERPGVCAVCGRETFVPFDSTGARLCDRHRHRPGDVVTDRETESALLVVGVTTDRADAVETAEGRLVADYESNRHYGGHEPVVDAVYLEDRAPRKRYRFPASRLRRQETTTDGRGERPPRSKAGTDEDTSGDSANTRRRRASGTAAPRGELRVEGETSAGVESTA